MDTLNATDIPAEFRVECANADYTNGCNNYADTRTGGDMNPYGPTVYTCDECNDDAVAAYYG